jgi:hypothetical protein
VENLFCRPRAFTTTTDRAVGAPVLAAYREFNTLTGSRTYSAADRDQMRLLLGELDVYRVNGTARSAAHQITTPRRA